MNNSKFKEKAHTKCQKDISLFEADISRINDKVNIALEKIDQCEERIQRLNDTELQMDAVSMYLLSKVEQLNGSISSFDNLRLELAQMNRSISSHNSAIANFTDMLLPYPVFDKLRVGSQVFSLYEASLPVQRIANTDDGRCTAGSDPNYPYGNIGGGNSCRYSTDR